MRRYPIAFRQLNFLFAWPLIIWHPYIKVQTLGPLS